MKHERLHALTDGIFAIVMTLLVLELKVPTVQAGAGNAELLNFLVRNSPLFLSYVLSFAVLFTYWRAHNFIVTVAAKNINITLSNINALFFLLVGLIPFSTHFLGLYHNTQVGVAVYGLNVILIGLTLYAMRDYVDKSSEIENAVIDALTLRNSRIRILLPVVFAALAIAISYWNTTASVMLFSAAVIFNLFSYTTNLINRLLGTPAR